MEDVTRDWRIESAWRMVVGSRFRDGRTIIEFRPAKSSNFIKVALSDGTVRTFDKSETLILAADSPLGPETPI